MLNICGCLVHAMPDKAEHVMQAINAGAGSEVHAHEDGRIVITVEDTADQTAAERIMDLHQIPGVITVTLTYHHFEAEEGDGPDAAPVIH